MDIDRDKDLLYIARLGLRAELEEPWKACKSKNGDIYYFNTETGKSCFN